MYVLAYTFQPEFCYDCGNSCGGCSEMQDYWVSHFTLHGLWPQIYDDGWDSYCTNEMFNRSVTDAIGWGTMTTYWPNIKCETADENDTEEVKDAYADFWEYEWEKHGTCSSLPQSAYFNTTVALIQSFGTPDIFVNATDVINADDLRYGFGGPTYVALQCENGEYISGAYTCWDMDAFTGLPTAQIECPDDVLAEDNCVEEDIHIA